MKHSRYSRYSKPQDNAFTRVNFIKAKINKQQTTYYTIKDLYAIIEKQLKGK